jgi:hypothetical protein
MSRENLNQLNTMKNLMKLLIVVILFTLASESYSQIGVKAGLNLSNMLIKDDYGTYSDESKMNPGFHVGATAEFPITEMISIETGLFLSTKGVKMSEKDIDYEYNSKANLFYIDVPLTVKAYINVGGSRIYGAIGPYIGMGISGKTTYEYKETGVPTETDTETISWGSDAENDDLKRLDYGLTAGAGVEINSIQIGVSYGFGLANISSYTGDGDIVNNRVLGISLGYKFGGK